MSATIRMLKFNKNVYLNMTFSERIDLQILYFEKSSNSVILSLLNIYFSVTDCFIFYGYERLG